MTKRLNNNKGVALMLTLAVLLIIVALANIILGTMLSQSRLTRHQTSRIQAYYAAMGTVNYAYQKLILNTSPLHVDPFWPKTPNLYTVVFCPAAVMGCQIPDSDLPNTIQTITVTVGAADPVTGKRSITALVNFAPSGSTTF